ncbi:MAG: hypothetical protein B1H40_04905 [Candidatus Latescibacteria bacterium 4484_181]|nr:MAG: hypothetical protein B1H40_04905 [Candidatus Latescibacteria bacterium 4484_181]
MGRQDVQNLLDNLKKNYPAVVEGVVPQQISVGTVQKVLQNLLRESEKECRSRTFSPLWKHWLIMPL